MLGVPNAAPPGLGSWEPGTWGSAASPQAIRCRASRYGSCRLVAAKASIGGDAVSGGSGRFRPSGAGAVRIGAFPAEMAARNERLPPPAVIFAGNRAGIGRSGLLRSSPVRRAEAKWALERVHRRVGRRHVGKIRPVTVRFVPVSYHDAIEHYTLYGQRRGDLHGRGASPVEAGGRGPGGETTAPRTSFRKSRLVPCPAGAEQLRVGRDPGR